MDALRWLAVVVVAAFCSTGCAPWNAVTRNTPKPGVTLPPGESASITSNRTDGPNYGCSFIEFDGKGGFLNFGQFKAAEANLQKLKSKSPVMLVMYGHGWQNNSQSGDVLSFLSFLRQLADSSEMRGYRVQGVYLGWRGSQYLPVLAGKASDETRAQLRDDFGGEVVDTRWHNPLPGPVIALPKVLSYFSIKSRAEYHVSRVPLSRSVFKLAFALKAPGENDRHRVFVLGHSFGALLLEQAIGQASVGLLASEWTHREAERWPFDLIVFLNSAAPSLYARQLKEFLEEDLRSTTARPRIVSITSKSDMATGVAHMVGNAPNRWFAMDLKRRYKPYVQHEGEARGTTDPTTVTAGDYYALTPGHNPLLVTRTIEKVDGVPLPALNGHNEVFEQNISRAKKPIERFYTWTNSRVQAWQLRELTPDERRAAAGGRLPGRYDSNYWIVSCDGTLIKGHSGIWTPECLEMLAGIYRMAAQMESVPARKRANRAD